MQARMTGFAYATQAYESTYTKWVGVTGLRASAHGRQSDKILFIVNSKAALHGSDTARRALAPLRCPDWWVGHQPSMC